MKRNLFLAAVSLVFVSSLVFADNVNIPKNNTPVFVKYESVYFYASDWDLGKKSGEVKNKKLFNFGNKAIVVGNTRKNNINYLNVQLPDKNKYWAPLDYFTTQFIVITGADVVTYNQPDESYATKVKLQPGVLGYLVKEDSGFINVDFNCYLPVNDKGVWLGNLWIKKDGFSDDIKTAEQASYLLRAYNLMYSKDGSFKAAYKELSSGLALGEETVVAPVIKDLMAKLDGTLNKSRIETVVGNSYSTTVEDLRLRETPGVDGKVVRILVKGEKLNLVEKGDEATIEGIKGIWVKVETEKGESGWCLDAYLADYKK